MPLRTAARMTAFNPGQSPPPVRIPTRMVLVLLRVPCESYCRVHKNEIRGVQSGSTRPDKSLPNSSLSKILLVMEELHHIARVGLLIAVAQDLLLDNIA